MGRVIALAILGIFTAILSKLLGEEAKAWLPWFTQKLLHIAIDNLPEDQRERFSEEWASHLNEVPGEIGKIATAASFVWAAREMTSVFVHGHSVAKQIGVRSLDIAAALFLLLFYFPIVLLAMIVTKCTAWHKPVFVRQEITSARQRTSTGYRLRLHTVVIEKQISNGQIIKVVRFSWWGRVLWHNRYHQYPLFYNVLRGHLTFVDLSSSLLDFIRLH